MCAHSPAFSGWLKTRVGGVVWKWRFFIAFDDGIVAWYPDEKDNNPEGQIELGLSHVQYHREHDPRSFVIANVGGGSIQLWAKDAQEASDWVAALVRVQARTESLHRGALSSGFNPALGHVDPRVVDPRLLNQHLAAAGVDPRLAESVAMQQMQRGGWLPPHHGIQRFPPQFEQTQAVEAPDWGEQLRKQQDILVNSAEFRQRKRERILAAKQALAEAPVLPTYGQVIEQETAHGKTEFVYMASCAPVALASRGATLVPGPDGRVSSAQMIAAHRRGAGPGAAPLGTIQDGGMEAAKRERERLEAENVQLQQQLESLKTGTATKKLETKQLFQSQPAPQVPYPVAVAHPVEHPIAHPVAHPVDYHVPAADVQQTKADWAIHSGSVSEALAKVRV